MILIDSRTRFFESFYDEIHLMRPYHDEKNATYCGILGFEIPPLETGVIDDRHTKFVTCDRCKEESAMYLLSKV